MNISIGALIMNNGKTIGLSPPKTHSIPIPSLMANKVCVRQINSSSSSTPPTSTSPNSPKIRSLSMSSNLAFSVVDEVGHMIHPSPSTSTPKRISGFPIVPSVSIGLKKSSSASSLTRLPHSVESVEPEPPPPLTLEDSSNDNDNDSPAGVTSASFSSEDQNDHDHDHVHFVNGIEDTETESCRGDHPSVSSVGKSTSSTSTSTGSGSHGGLRSEVLIGIVVSRWDNIVGPQCIYLWTEERTSTFYPGRLPSPLVRHVKYVTDHTVDHHDVDGNLVPPSTIRSALCLVHDLDLAYLSLSIRVPSADSIGNFDGGGLPTAAAMGGGDGGDFPTSGDRPAVTVPHAVAVLARLEFLQDFLLMRPLISNWLAEFAPKISVLLCKNQLQSSMVNSWCAELCKTMSTLWNCWWQQQQRSAFEGGIENIPPPESPTPAPVVVPETEVRTSRSGITFFKRKVSPPKVTSKENEFWDYLPPPFSGKFSLDQILTSHLSTSGTSIIVGSDVAAMNQVIRFLLCFSKPEEGYCSRYVLPSLPDTFMKGVFVQGLVLGKIGEKSISVNQITSNLYPSTHIEMNGKTPKIRQTSVTTHKHRREGTLVQELTSLWSGSPYSSPSTELFPQQVKEVAGFVSRFVSDLNLLKPERRFARLLLFRRSLHAKVISLISYLHSIRLKPDKETMGLVKSLKDTLRMDEAEFLIVQITAEKIRPGILAMLRSY